MIPRIQQSFQESTSSLLVGCVGLGLSNLLACSLQPYCNSSSLVFVLRASKEAQRTIRDLSNMGVTNEFLPRILNSTTTSTTDREKMYLRGGVYVCTSRILVLDLLQQRVVPNAITGIFVNDAHRISAASTEAFVIQMFREGNHKPGAFVKGITEDACSLVGGFNKVGKLMETLSIGNICLWPRFHLVIKEHCSKHPPDVVQLAVSLTTRMKRIQASIIEIMCACTAQLAHQSGVDLHDVTPEMNILPSADVRLRQKINKSKILKGTKLRSSNELMSDLKTLRHMLSSLLTHDCVSYYNMLESIRIAASLPLSNSSGLFQKEPSQWLLLEATETLYRTAKERVHLPIKYQPKNNKKAPLGKKPAKRSRTVTLEQNPKWHVLLEILGEIRNHVASHSSRPSSSSSSSSSSPKRSRKRKSTGNIDNPIIIFCRTARTVAQLTGVLTSSPRDYLRQKYTHFIKKTKSGGGVNSGSNISSSSSSSSSNNNNRSRKDNRKKNQPREQHTSFKHMTSSLGLPDVQTGLAHWWATERNAKTISHQQSTASMTIDPNHSNTSNTSTFLCTGQHAKRLDSQNIFIELHDKRNSNRAYDILHEVEPSFVIMYDANPTLTRQLELYAAARPNKVIRVYFLVYEGSVEERRYLDDVERERSAFQRLIEHKSLMTGTDRNNTSTSMSVFNTANVMSEHQPIDTSRQGGKKRSKKKEKGNEGEGDTGTNETGTEGDNDAKVHQRCVVVDTREFRSILPLMLHREGLEIVPMTLTVGDYILTPKICIERKSIPDLFSSLKSGRLYKQAEQMCTHFEHPMLLIEFDDSRPFRLVDELSRDVSQHSIVSKLVLVLLHFPALHFLWMSHPRATASLFSRLKENRDEPEDHIGAASDLNSNSFDSTENTAAYLTNQDTLRKVPGMTAGNFHKVIGKVNTLGQLSQMSLTSLQGLMGKMGGKKAHAFFNAEGIGQI